MVARGEWEESSNQQNQDQEICRIVKLLLTGGAEPRNHDPYNKI